jgi:carboxypeptidase T
MSAKISQVLLFALLLATSAQAENTAPDANYWRLGQIVTQLEAWEAEYPGLCQVMSLGQSGLNQNIPMICISDNAALDEGEPGLYFQGALHSDEPNGTTAIMKSIKTLLEGYGKDASITARVDGLVLYFVPVLNVDGHNHVFNGGKSWEHWRKTLRDNNENGTVEYPVDGVDLNRNWDWNWGTYGEGNPESLKFKGPFPGSEAEVLVVQDFIRQNKPVIAVDYHSPVTMALRKCIFWPWMDPETEVLGPDADVARDVAFQWAAATVDENGEPYRGISGYTTLPKFQNWVYGKLGILAYTMEISDHCWWTGDDVASLGNRVARGSDVLLDRVLVGPGINGSVVNAANGEPLEAEVIINEMDAPDVGPRLTNAGNGAYYRLTMPGQYTVTVICKGFNAQTKVVTVVDSWQNVDFSLRESLGQ